MKCKQCEKDSSEGSQFCNKCGIVYLLTNPAMEGYVKVGFTKNLEQRIKELDSTGVPLPFVCVFAIQVKNARKVEKLIHSTFLDAKVRPNREFFEVNPERIMSALELTEGLDVTPKQDIVEDADAQKALDKANKKEMGRQFNFEMVGLKRGTILTFSRDENVTCEVNDDRQVIFEGEITSLTAAAKKALKDIGAYNISIRGPLYWEYDGKSLNDLRNQVYK